MSEICTKNMERNDICPDDTEPIYLKLDSEEGIASLLTMDDFTAVYELADKTRREAVGDTVHLRAIIEFSNVCRRQCR